MEEGKYIYCVIGADEEKDFGPLGIGERNDMVHSIGYRNIAAVVSDSPDKEYPISRVNMLAHQKVMELLMDSYTVLPVKFGTIAKGNAERGPAERIRREVLGKRYKELRDLIVKMEGKTELGVKCLWVNMDSIFKEIVEENQDIKRTREKIARGHPIKTHDARVGLGEMVKKALDRKREKENVRILNSLKPLCADLELGNIFGDNMVTNSSFLMPKEKMDEFDAVVNQISSESDGRMKFKYVGPVPPCNFVELTIVLE